mmetsp:Transcript_45163/g.114881  ORF Transcript_45163/g.114881 Transcript_45163/m.114881 type:complete len:219 (-) Transcript_45163:829-1485(-)
MYNLMRRSCHGIGAVLLHTLVVHHGGIVFVFGASFVDATALVKHPLRQLLQALLPMRPRIEPSQLLLMRRTQLRDAAHKERDQCGADRRPQADDEHRRSLDANLFPIPLDGALDTADSLHGKQACGEGAPQAADAVDREDGDDVVDAARHEAAAHELVVCVVAENACAHADEEGARGRDVAGGGRRRAKAPDSTAHQVEGCGEVQHAVSVAAGHCRTR